MDNTLQTVDALPPAAASTASRQSRLTVTAALCAVVVMATGVAVLVGWRIGNQTLMTLLPGHFHMMPNTALSFVLLGAALAMRLLPYTPANLGWARGLAVAGGLISVLTMSEYLFHVDLHIDQLLFADPGKVRFPGRMAQLAAVNFLLAALSLLPRGLNGATRIVSQALAIVLLCNAFASILATCYAISFSSNAADYLGIALHSSIGFFILGIGILLIHRNSTLVDALASPYNGGWMARRLLPGVVLLPVLLGWIYLQPTLNLAGPRLGMAILAVTLAFMGSVGLWLVAFSLNRAERHQQELSEVREQAAAAARKSERELRLVTDHLPTLLSYIDLDGRFVRVNRTYEQWTGVKAEEIVGKTILQFMGEDYWARAAFAREAVMRGEIITFETLYPTVRGERSVQVTYAPDIDEDGSIRGIACMVLDVEDQRRAELAADSSRKLEVANRILNELATTDPLTGLKNRRALEDSLAVEFHEAANQEHDLSVLMIDIDDFKLCNDTWGHAAGDEVLRALGKLMLAAIRKPDMAARYGGEEFAILLPQSSMEHAAVVAKRLTRMVAKYAWEHGPITLSIGLASRTNRMESAADLVAQADLALYTAKRQGKNRVCRPSDTAECATQPV